MSSRSIDRGDTIVEVIVSFAVFAVVAVSVSVLMNRGLAIGQQSLELSLVREQINAQAEMLRFARYDSESAASWHAIKNRVRDGTNAATRPESCTQPPSAGSGAFTLYPSSGGTPPLRLANATDRYITPAMSSYVDTTSGNAHGLWIQAARAEDISGSSAQAYDFYIHACWYLPASDTPQRLLTVVRLYDGA